MANAFKTNWSIVQCKATNQLLFSSSQNTVSTTYYLPDSGVNNYYVKMWDGTYFDLLKLIPSVGVEPDSLYLNNINYLNIADRWNYYKGVGYATGYGWINNRGGQVPNILFCTKPGDNTLHKWMNGALTDEYSIGRYIDKFYPTTAQIKPTGYSATYCPPIGYNPIFVAMDDKAITTGQNPWSLSFTRTTGSGTNNVRWIQIKADVDSNGYGVFKFNIGVNSGTYNVKTYTLTQETFRNNILPNRLGLLANAAGGGGYNGTGSGNYGGGGSGAWCAIVLNMYWLKEDTNRYYLIDLGATVNASPGYGGSDLTISRHSNSTAIGTTMLTLTGGGVGYNTSGGGKGTCTFNDGKNTYWWPILNANNSYNEFTDANFYGKGGSESADAIKFTTTSFCGGLYYRNIDRPHAGTKYGGSSIFGASKSGTADPGAGGYRGGYGGAAKVTFYY